MWFGWHFTFRIVVRFDKPPFGFMRGQTLMAVFTANSDSLTTHFGGVPKSVYSEVNVAIAPDSSQS